MEPISLAVVIDRPAEEVFAFLRDIELQPPQLGEGVTQLDKLTPGPVRVGTRYREVMPAFAWREGRYLSEITAYEPPSVLAESFEGPHMDGTVEFRLEPADGGTRLTQVDHLRLRGPSRLLERLVRRSLEAKLTERLADIKRLLEQPGPAAQS